MITFKEFGRYGRLGNMMLQYAALYGCAKKTGFKAVLPRQQSLYGVEWPYKTSIPFVSRLEVEGMKTYAEPKFSFNENIWNISDDTSLHGYFQSEKYFDFCRDDILRELSFDPDNRSLYEDHIAIHIRRGDYVNHPNIHPCIPVKWYERMINKYKHSDKAKVFLFTDIADTIDMGLFPENVHLVRNLPHIEIYMMAKCRTVIMANSSFSWWGGWLNNRPDRQIIAPYPWFGPGGPQEFEDVYCKGWIKEKWQ